MTTLYKVTGPKGEANHGGSGSWQAERLAHYLHGEDR